MVLQRGPVELLRLYSDIDDFARGILDDNCSAQLLALVQELLLPPADATASALLSRPKFDGGCAALVQPLPHSTRRLAGSWRRLGNCGKRALAPALRFSVTSEGTRA